MSNYYGSSSDSGSGFSELTIAILKLIGGVIVCLIVIGIINSSNQITEENAMERFVEITGTTDIVIVRSSNNDVFFGDPHDVTFELRIDGKNVSARCTSGIFSPMVCRIYDDE